ncbi:waprin-Enh1 [Protobothrops mucrosquamatus]|uniref:waprin-Enh1 n=1 Tax=Protobothrops mucrosquamatus TaxID=103944 RepID=UPI0007757F49|nr:waprin-Enh1 [Protobothrops mucrosquamatus]
MKTLTGLLLVGLLALWTGLPFTSSRVLFGTGICPGNPFQCSLPGINSCRRDYDCPQTLRCCNFRCSTSCRFPPVIPWSCPRNPFKCTIPGIHRCRYDYDCPGRQRCCYYNCSRICK